MYTPTGSTLILFGHVDIFTLLHYPLIRWITNHYHACPYTVSLSQYIIVSSLLKTPSLTLFDYVYPDWSITVGYMIGLSSFMWVPIYMVYKLVWTPGSLKQVSQYWDLNLYYPFY